MYNRAFFFFTAVAIASATCLHEEECVAINATDAAGASAMLQVKASKVSSEAHSLAFHGAATSQLAESRTGTCISDVLQAAHVQALEKQASRSVQRQQANVSKSGHGTKGPPINDAFGQCEGSSSVENPSGKSCSVYMGAGAPAKTGTCSQHGAHAYMCNIGQKAPCAGFSPSDPNPPTGGIPCTFEGHEGKCELRFISEFFCNIWPVAGPCASGGPHAPGTKCMVDGSEGTCSMRTNGQGIAKGYTPFCRPVEDTKPTEPAAIATTGASASLDGAGFKATTSLCCPSEMETFFNRLLESRGLSVCSKPHVQGLMHWFSCVPDMDFQYMLDVMANGNPCKYWAPTGTDCPALSPECAGSWCR